MDAVILLYITNAIKEDRKHYCSLKQKEKSENLMVVKVVLIR